GEPPLGGRGPVDRVAGEQQALGAGRADAKSPERARRHTPDPRGRVADLRPVLDDQQVGAKRHVRAAGDAVAVHLRDRRLVGVKQAHEATQVAAHHLVVGDRVPGALRVVVSGLDHRVEGRSGGRLGVRDPLEVPLSRGDEVVAAAEPRAVAGQGDHVDLRVEVRTLNAGRELARHLEGDAVAPLRPMQGDAGDPPGHVVGQRLVPIHRLDSISAMSPGRIPVLGAKMWTVATKPKKPKTATAATKSKYMTLEVSGREVRLSNPGKLFFPKPKFTKLDLAEYYVAVEEAAVNQLRERPGTMKRFVDGVDGEFFFQKRVPKGAPGWLQTATCYLRSGGRAAE